MVVQFGRIIVQLALVALPLVAKSFTKAYKAAAASMLKKLFL